MLKVSSILIGVSNLNKAKLFYEQVFGFVFQEFRPPFASATFDGLEFNIEEDADYRPDGWVEANVGGRKCISFQADDLTVFIARAESFGATILQTPEVKPWGWKEAVFSDPDGNEFIIEQMV